MDFFLAKKKSNKKNEKGKKEKKKNLKMEKRNEGKWKKEAQWLSLKQLDCDIIRG